MDRDWSDEIAAPVLIGAVGGSGTRVVARLLERAGYFIGARRNEAEDSEPVMDFYNAWMRPYVESGFDAAMGPDFRKAIVEHRRGMVNPRAPWAVKVPRSILMLPFWRDAFPALRFILVVRNGLDMAYSSDTNQLRMFSDLVLHGAERTYTGAMRAMAYWRTANLSAAVQARMLFGDRFHVLRFDDLCRNPAGTIKDLAGFLGAEMDVVEAASEVEPPRGLSRWRGHPDAEVQALLKIGRPALEQFGFWDQGLFDTLMAASHGVSAGA